MLLFAEPTIIQTFVIFWKYHKHKIMNHPDNEVGVIVFFCLHWTWELWSRTFFNNFQLWKSSKSSNRLQYQDVQIFFFL